MEAKTSAAVELPERLHPEQRIKLPLVKLLTGNGKTKIYADIKAGTFPAPERDGIRCSRWRAGTVIDHLNQKRSTSGVD